MKLGVNLPKPLEDWNLTNTFFIANISCEDIKGRDLNTVVQDFNTIIYDYFKTNFGIVKTYNDQEFKEMYSNFTKRQLRNELKCFKKENTDRNAIVYVSKLLRSKVQPKPNVNIDNINHDEEVSKDFWSFCKPVALKVLTSLIRDRIYTFLASNNYIEGEI